MGLHVVRGQFYHFMEHFHKIPPPPLEIGMFYRDHCCIIAWPHYFCFVFGSDLGCGPCGLQNRIPETHNSKSASGFRLQGSLGPKSLLFAGLLGDMRYAILAYGPPRDGSY